MVRSIYCASSERIAIKRDGHPSVILFGLLSRVFHPNLWKSKKQKPEEGRAFFLPEKS